MNEMELRTVTILRRQFKRGGALLLVALMAAACSAGGATPSTAPVSADPSGVAVPSTAASQPPASASTSPAAAGNCAVLAPSAAIAVPDLPAELPCPDVAETPFKIGILHVGDCPYCSGLLAAYEEQAELLNVEITVLNGQLKPDLQAQQIDQLIAQQPDAILAVPIDTRALIPGLARAKAAGIPVIDATIAVDPAGEEYVVGYVGIDDVLAGKLSADLMIKALGGQGKVAVVAGAPGGSEVLRTKGFVDQVAAAAPNMEIVAIEHGDFTKEKALSLTRDLISRFGDDLDGIWAEDDTMGSGVSQGVAEAGRSDSIVVTGMNGNKAGCEEIKAGRMYGTIVQQPYVDGAWSVIYTVDVLQGKAPGKYIALTQPEINQENIDEWLPRCW